MWYQWDNYWFWRRKRICKMWARESVKRDESNKAWLGTWVKALWENSSIHMLMLNQSSIKVSLKRWGDGPLICHLCLKEKSSTLRLLPLWKTFFCKNIRWCGKEITDYFWESERRRLLFHVDIDRINNEYISSKARKIYIQ